MVDLLKWYVIIAFVNTIGLNEMAKPYKWKVEPSPTGRYRSFQPWGWPSAFAPDGQIVARIECPTRYSPRKVALQFHEPLTVKVADYRTTPFTWRKIKGQFKTIPEAKTAFEELIKKYPDILPK